MTAELARRAYASGTSRGRSTQGLLKRLLFVLTVAPVFMLVQPAEMPMFPRMLGEVLWLFCLVPAWQYLGVPLRQREPIPFLPTIGVLYGFYYAWPLLQGTTEVPTNRWITLMPERYYAGAAVATIIVWTCLFVTFNALQSRHSSKGISLLIHSHCRLLSWAVWFTLFGIGFSTILSVVRVPTVIRGSAVFLDSVGRLGIVLLVMHWSAGYRLTFAHRGLALGGVGFHLFRFVGVGLVSPLALFVIMILFAVWGGRMSLSRRAVAVALVGIVSLVAIRSVAEEFRFLMWVDYGSYSMVERSTTMMQLLQTKVEKEGLSNSVAEGGQIIASRSANLLLLADVMRQTPDLVPFWKGRTYFSLVGAVVPRFLWPNKPEKTTGQDFGHSYAYLGTTDTVTSYNLPWVVEAYANFGWLGICLIGIVIGFVYDLLHRLVNVPGQSMLETAIGITLFVPLLNIESDFSLTFGGLLMTAAAFWLLGRVMTCRIRTW